MELSEVEGFLGFLSVILAFMYWGKRGDYEDLRSKVGSIDAYKITVVVKQNCNASVA